MAAGEAEIDPMSNPDIATVGRQHEFEMHMQQFGGDFGALLSQHTVLEQCYETLREAHNKFAEAAQKLGEWRLAAGALCLMADQSGEIRYASDGANARLGLKKHNIRRLQQLVNPFHLPHLKIMLDSLTGENNSLRCDPSDFFLRSEGPTDKDHLFCMEAFPLALGRTALMCWVLRDLAPGSAKSGVSERLPRPHHQPQQGYAVTDELGTLLGVDARFSRVTGFSRADLVGQTTDKFWSGDETISSTIWTEVQCHGWWQGPVTSCTREGSPLHQWLTVTSLKDDANRAGAFMLLLSDLALHRSAQRALQEEFRQVFAPDQFFLRYQAHVATGAGFKLIACEAHTDWRHPTDTNLDGKRYSSHAGHQATGLESAVWMIRTSGLQLKTWQAQGLSDIALVLNLTAVQITSAAVADAVADLPALAGIGPDRLELTITEAESARITDKSLERLLALRRMGVKITVRDFGSGHASLEALRLLALRRMGVRITVRDFGSGHASLEALQMRPFDRLRLEQGFTAMGVPPEQAETSQWAQAIGVCMNLGHLPPGADEENGAQSYLKSSPMLPDQLVSWVSQRALQCVPFKEPHRHQA